MLTPAVGAELDRDALQRLRELDPSGANRLLARVFQAFSTSTARLMPQMHAALAAGDRDGVRHVVHTLKSSSASIGALRLAALCGEIEALVRADESAAPEGVDSLPAQVESMDRELAAVLQALEQVAGPLA